MSEADSISTSPPVPVSGQRFGKLTVVERTRTHGGRWGWLCKCDCGGQTITTARSLRRGTTKSCGCLRYVTGFVGHNRTHGCRFTRGYKAWQSMKERCLLPHHKSYRSYGGAGITICDRWLESFENFLADMGQPPTGHTLDRFPNPAGNYEPGNCRWATNSQQQRNKNNNRLLTAFGETKCAADWLDDDRCKANSETLYKRIELGWDHERVISQPMKPQRNRTVQAMGRRAKSGS